jgi:hypothetical protein
VSFHQVLKRLQSTVDDPSLTGRGDATYRVVRADDLRELLYHFFRIDNEFRELYAQKVHKEHGASSQNAKDDYTENISNRYDVSSHQVDNVTAMHYYRDKVTASKEVAIEALKHAGIFTKDGEIADEYKSLFRSIYDEQVQVSENSSSSDEPWSKS